jgi:hypothetical protein
MSPTPITLGSLSRPQMSGTSSTPGNALRSTYGQRPHKQLLMSIAMPELCGRYQPRPYATYTHGWPTPRLLLSLDWQQQVPQSPEAYLLRPGVAFALKYNLVTSLRRYSGEVTTQCSCCCRSVK